MIDGKPRAIKVKTRIIKQGLIVKPIKRKYVSKSPDVIAGPMQRRNCVDSRCSTGNRQAANLKSRPCFSCARTVPIWIDQIPGLSLFSAEFWRVYLTCAVLGVPVQMLFCTHDDSSGLVSTLSGRSADLPCWNAQPRLRASRLRRLP